MSGTGTVMSDLVHGMSSFTTEASLQRSDVLVLNNVLKAGNK